MKFGENGNSFQGDWGAKSPKKFLQVLGLNFSIFQKISEVNFSNIISYLISLNNPLSKKFGGPGAEPPGKCL